ncbi:biotin transporter BioY [Thalassospira marina]|uniref:Biotin transporter n=1 Tax=Thalassospira marina TaxID=2048283 RepID=A0A2N3KW13_9PROT|nr:biotin transporter BioY [Thalassospira marina]PKR54765.1 BioY family transporter [Thalassospira marina]
MSNPASKPGNASALHGPKSDAKPALKYSLMILAGVAVLTASAKITIPFWPVPMTLQTMAIMTIALATGPRLACATVLGYLAAGAVGLPVFAGTPERGIGLAYMVGPTGGYLLGYLVAAWMVGSFARGRGMFARFGIMMTAMIPVYVLGLAWLAVFVPLEKLAAYGFTPFVPGDVVKVALVALGSQALGRLVKRNTGEHA